MVSCVQEVLLTTIVLINTSRMNTVLCSLFACILCCVFIWMVNHRVTVHSTPWHRWWSDQQLERRGGLSAWHRNSFFSKPIKCTTSTTMCDNSLKITYGKVNAPVSEWLWFTTGIEWFQDWTPQDTLVTCVIGQRMDHHVYRSNYFSDYTNLVLPTPMKYVHNNATARIYHIWSTTLCWSTIYARHAHTHTQMHTAK